MTKTKTKDTNPYFEEHYKIYFIERKLIQRIARKLSLGNEDLYEELVQEGLIRLWTLDPTRATSNLDSFIRQAIKFGLIDFLRSNKPKRHDSLDSRLLSGEQIEQDSATGELRLISHRQNKLMTKQQEQEKETSSEESL